MELKKRDGNGEVLDDTQIVLDLESLGLSQLYQVDFCKHALKTQKEKMKPLKK